MDKKSDTAATDKRSSKASKLVIVESPTKARTIGRILGDDFALLSSYGHVRDLPERTLGVDIAQSFHPTYKETKPKQVSELRKNAKAASEIFLATDPDREGEAIAWHIREILANGTKANFKRVEFHEITANAIQEAFAQPRDINFQLVDAQQARRVLDRLVGYQISPLLWSNIEKGISAGRVQSVALRLVVEREREITSFTPREYWVFKVKLSPKDRPKESFYARLVKINGKKADVPDADAAQKAKQQLDKARQYQVKLYKEEPGKKSPPPPFITSSLQQTAGAYLRFSAQQTMRVAQQLYEGADIGEDGPSGLITYMRTDSFTISKEAQGKCLQFIRQRFGDDFAPSKPNRYRNKSTAQEAHEAIRPTDVSRTPEMMEKFLDRDQARLYRLVWNRFVSSQMTPAKLRRTTVDCDAITDGPDTYTFRATATEVVFPGFMKVLAKNEKEEEASDPDAETDEDAGIPRMNQNDMCDQRGLSSEQKFTEPPPRYSEATLIRELEANGVGRPSTYATIVNTIQKRKYVLKRKGKLIPEDLGCKVNDYLLDKLPKLFDVGFTADMEKKLDNIESGQERWTEMLAQFYDPFSKWVDEAKYKLGPDADKARRVLDMLEQVKEWEKPRKLGKRTYCDRRFATSVRNQFQKNSKMSGKQWNSVLNLAVKYRGQLPELQNTARNMGFEEELQNASKAREQEQNAHRQAEEQSKGRRQTLAKAFEMLGELQLEPPAKGAFDEKGFLESLSKRVEDGGVLSDRQMNALKRLVINHKNKIKRFPEIAGLLEIKTLDKNEHPGKNNPDNSSDKPGANENPETARDLAFLQKVQAWNEPVKKGKKTYDDQAFYNSLRDQYQAKGALSPRQTAALRKMADKYRKKEGEKKSD